MQILKSFFFIIVTSFMINMSGLSQDTIVRSNGDLIYGKIIKEDSLNIYFYLYKNNHRLSTYIHRNDVFSYTHHTNVDTIPKKIYKYHGTISMAYGTSIPIGEYRSINFNDHGSGYAKVGTNFMVTYAYRINKHFGFDGKINYGVNNCDPEPVINLYQSHFQTADFKTRYRYQTTMLGMSVYQSVNKIDAFCKIYVGPSLMETTGYVKEVDEHSTEYTIRNIHSLILTYSIDMSFGLLYPLNSKINIIVVGDYIHCKFKTEVFDATWGSQNNAVTHRVIGGNQKYNVINLSAGIQLEI